MLKIIDLHQSQSPGSEYVVLQNQGLITISLAGWILVGGVYMAGDAALAASETYIFTQDVGIKPYTRVVLFTGPGEDGWYATIDNKAAYLAYWNRSSSAWSATESVHLLQPVSTRRLVRADAVEFELA